jgi:hypothetical protein
MAWILLLGAGAFFAYEFEKQQAAANAASAAGCYNSLAPANCAGYIATLNQYSWLPNFSTHD